MTIADRSQKVQVYAGSPQEPQEPQEYHPNAASNSLASHHSRRQLSATGYADRSREAVKGRAAHAHDRALEATWRGITEGPGRGNDPCGPRHGTRWDRHH